MSWNILVVVRSLLVLSTCYIVTRCIWSVFFSKLSKIPGPKLAAATRFVFIYHNARGNGEAWKVELHRIYGDVVRVTPDEVSFATGAAWKYIYGNAPGSQYVRSAKDPLFYGGQIAAPSLITADDVDHSQQRKCFSHAFSEKALREQESLIQGYISQLVSNVRQATEAPESQKLNLARQFYFSTFDIMGDLAWGAPLDCLARGEYIDWIKMIFDNIKMITVIAEVNRFPSIQKLLQAMIPKSLKAKKEQHEKYCADQVDRRLARTTDKSDIWHYVLAAKDKNRELTKDQMYVNAGAFMIAGTETSATLMSGLTFYLLSSPEKLRAITTDLRQRFQSAEEITAQSVQSSKYLTACIQEALRLHPPVPFGLPRVVPKGGADLCGYNIPEDITFYVHHLATYRNPRNFADPDTFHPERWLSESDAIDILGKDKVDLKQFANDDKSCLQPFSVGPRNCIGQNLAWLEIRLIMAHLLWHFDFELCDESRTWDEHKIFTLWATPPLMIVPKVVAC